MTLTPEQIQQLRQKYNLGTGATTSVATDRISSLREKLKQRAGVTVSPEGITTGPQTLMTEADVIKPEEPGFFSRIGSKLKDRFGKIVEKQEQLFEDEIHPLEAALPVLGQVAGGITDVLEETFISGVKALTPDATERFLADKAQDVLQTEGGQKAINALNQGFEAWEGFKAENPRVADQVEGVVNIGLLFPEAKGATSIAKGGIKISKGALKKTVNKIDDLKNFRNSKQVLNIEDKIAPGINSRQMKEIIKAGRVEKGPQSKLFGAKKDIITQTEEVKRAADTVKRRISGASKMDDFQLVNAANKEIESVAKKLKSKLQGVKVSPKQKGIIDESWDTLKRSQANDPELSTVPGFSKLQSNFETFLDDLKKPIRGKDGRFREKSLDDIWEARKKYDNSVKDNIKNAGPNSSSDLQFKKQIWLENRRILNDLIDDMSKKLGGNSRKSFNEMADLYRVVNNVSSKAKIKLDDVPGVLSTQTLKRAIIRYGLPGALGYQILFD